MPIFIDGHDMKNISIEDIKKNINEHPDENGVRYLEILFSENEKKVFCILEAPNKEAVRYYHEDNKIECDFVFEVNQIKPEFIEGTQRLQVMGELSARVAHDLRNPLGVIKNAIELMEMDSKDDHNEKMIKRISMIKNASNRMLRQINDVLDFIRTKPLDLENYSLTEMVDSALKISVPENVKISKPTNDVNILCDNKQLEVVFSNLINNAIQAIEGQGEIKIRIVDGSKDVEIEFEDSGQGISEENMKKIFDPLFTTKSSGTGLGLVSCKNIVEQHNGKLFFKNNPTIFTVKIPKKILN